MKPEILALKSMPTWSREFEHRKVFRKEQIIELIKQFQSDQRDYDYKEFGQFLVDHYIGMKERQNPDALSLFAIILNYEMRYKVAGLREQCLE